MARPPAKELTDRELQVMQVFWQHGEATASAGATGWPPPGWTWPM